MMEKSKGKSKIKRTLTYFNYIISFTMIILSIIFLIFITLVISMINPVTAIPSSFIIIIMSLYLIGGIFAKGMSIYQKTDEKKATFQSWYYVFKHM